MIHIQWSFLWTRNGNAEVHCSLYYVLRCLHAIMLYYSYLQQPFIIQNSIFMHDTTFEMFNKTCEVIVKLSKVFDIIITIYFIIPTLSHIMLIKFIWKSKILNIFCYHFECHITISSSKVKIHECAEIKLCKGNSINIAHWFMVKLLISA